MKKRLFDIEDPKTVSNEGFFDRFKSNKNSEAEDVSDKHINPEHFFRDLPSDNELNFVTNDISTKDCSAASIIVTLFYRGGKPVQDIVSEILKDTDFIMSNKDKALKSIKALDKAGEALEKKLDKIPEDPEQGIPALEKLFSSLPKHQNIANDYANAPMLLSFKDPIVSKSGNSYLFSPVAYLTGVKHVSFKAVDKGQFSKLRDAYKKLIEFRTAYSNNMGDFTPLDYSDHPFRSFIGKSDSLDNEVNSRPEYFDGGYNGLVAGLGHDLMVHAGRLTIVIASILEASIATGDNVATEGFVDFFKGLFKRKPKLKDKIKKLSDLNMLDLASDKDSEVFEILSKLADRAVDGAWLKPHYVDRKKMGLDLNKFDDMVSDGTLEKVLDKFETQKHKEIEKAEKKVATFKKEGRGKSTEEVLELFDNHLGEYIYDFDWDDYLDFGIDGTEIENALSDDQTLSDKAMDILDWSLRTDSLDLEFGGVRHALEKLIKLLDPKEKSEVATEDFSEKVPNPKIGNRKMKKKLFTTAIEEITEDLTGEPVGSGVSEEESNSTPLVVNSDEEEENKKVEYDAGEITDDEDRAEEMKETVDEQSGEEDEDDPFGGGSDSDSDSGEDSMDSDFGGDDTNGEGDGSDEELSEDDSEGTTDETEEQGEEQTEDSTEESTESKEQVAQEAYETYQALHQLTLEGYLNYNEMQHANSLMGKFKQFLKDATVPVVTVAVESHEEAFDLKMELNDVSISAMEHYQVESMEEFFEMHKEIIGGKFIYDEE